MTDEYVPPPGSHDPQLAWLQHQLPPAPARSAERPASAAPAPPTWHEPPAADDDEWVEEDTAFGDEWVEEDTAFDEDDAEEERTPTRQRRRPVATDTALIPRRWIIFVIVWTVRTMMLALLGASFVGSIASFNPAGIAPVLAAFPWLRSAAPWVVVGANQTATLIGIGLQLWITGVEYWKAPRRLRQLLAPQHWFYTAHLGLDVCLTVYGWRPVILPWLLTLIAKTLVALAISSAPPWTVLVAAYGLLGVLALGCALLPERVLLRD